MGEGEGGRRLANKIVMPILCLGRRKRIRSEEGLGWTTRKRVVLACLVHGRMSGSCENE